MVALGRNCDRCGEPLSDKNFKAYGSWDYKCPNCRFVYKHGITNLNSIIKRARL